MKVFLNKFKKAPWVMKIFYFLILILYWVSYGFFCHSLLSLVGIETFIRIIILIFAFVYGIIFTGVGLMKMFQHKKVGFIVLSILSILFIGIFSLSSHYIDKLYTKI